MNADKYWLVKGAAGLGNRMQSALTGILCARLTGRRLLVDWSDHYYSGDGSNVFHRFFQCPSCSPTDEIPVTDSVVPDIWRGRLRKSIYDMREHYGGGDGAEAWPKFSVDLTNLEHHEDVAVMWTYTERVDALRGHFTGAFRGLAEMSAGAILRKSLQEDLLLHPHIRERVDEFKGNYFREKIVGVHVRYTDQRCRLWAILGKLNALLKCEPDLRIFLATDNLQIKKMFEESYARVIATPHWYSSTSGLAIHYHRGRAAPVQSGIEALIDLYLLAESDYLIIDSSSSFSYVAKLLTKAPDANVFDVGHRDPPSRRRRKLITRLMLTLGMYSWGLGLLRKVVRMQRHFSG